MGKENPKLSGRISHVGDTTHVEFSGAKQWDYKIVKEEGKNQLKLLLFPFDQAAENQLKSWKDSLVSSVSIDKNGIDEKYVVIFQLKDRDVEIFDYLTDDPSRLIIDFYRPPTKKQESLSAQEVPIKQPEKKKKKIVQKMKSDQKGTGGQQRKPAGSEFLQGSNEPVPVEESTSQTLLQMRGVFDGNDPQYTRFQVKDHEIKEESMIASKQNIFIRFPILQMSSSEMPQLLNNSPEYVITPREDKENKQARFLLNLYSKNRQAAFMKTFEYFNNQYPESTYAEIVHNMAADIYFDLYQKDKNPYYFQKLKNEYQYLLTKFADSPLAERRELFLSYLDFDRNDAMSALQSLQSFVERRPQSSHLDQAKRAIAASLILLGKFKDAKEVYNDLIQNAKNPDFSQEATYRLGDVAFSQREHQDAIQLYQQALKKYPQLANKYPNALYNLAESEFWTGDYQSSLKNYIQFLKFFPNHSHGGYATTRIGELMEIMGIDQTRVMGVYLESYFRFNENPGAGVARIRLLAQQMKGMKEKELKKAVTEMSEIAAHSSLPKMDEFMNLMVSDGYHRRKEYDQSLSYLVSYYQDHPSSPSLPFFYKRILNNIVDQLQEMVLNQKYMEALSHFAKYSSTWIKRSDRLDIPYFLGQSYEQAGAYSASEKIYEEVFDHLKKIAGTQEEKEKRVNEHLPTMDEVNLRLSTVALMQKKFIKAHQYLLSIKAPDSLSQNLQIEMIENLAKVAEERGQADEAMKYLVKLVESWKQSPDLLPPIYLRLADMQSRRLQWMAAENSLNSIYNLKAKGTKVSDEVWAATLEKKGDVLYQQKKVLAGVESYLELLEQDEEKRPLAYIRYKVGSILFETGDIKGAEKIWEGLKQDKANMYKKLAAERMSQAEWQDDYKKYIDRIPAMEPIRKKKGKTE